MGRGIIARRSGPYEVADLQGWKALGVLTALSLLLSGCAPVPGSTAGRPTAGQQGDIFAGLPKEGQRAPNATLVDLQGSQLKISDLKGRPLIINFWATWCPPCRAEIPELDAVYREHRDKGLEVLGINYGEESETVQGFLKGMEVSYRIVMDPYDEAADRYRIAALPTSFFVDSEGIIRAVHLGGMDRQAIEGKLAKILPTN